MKRPRKASENEEDQQSEDIASSDEQSIANSEEEDDNDKEDTVDPEPSASSSQPPTKKRKRGIIYLSTIPKHMTVAIARDMFSQYANIGRMYFQPETKTGGAGMLIDCLCLLSSE